MSNQSQKSNANDRHVTLRPTVNDRRQDQNTTYPTEFGIRRAFQPRTTISVNERQYLFIFMVLKKISILDYNITYEQREPKRGRNHEKESGSFFFIQRRRNPTKNVWKRMGSVLSEGKWYERLSFVGQSRFADGSKYY